MEIQELDDYLKVFKTAVEKADLTDSKKINFFSATKMLTLETKHSAFLAWLLDPSFEHCLKSAVLEKLLTKLYDYQTVGDKNTAKPKKNNEILKDNKCRRHKPINDKKELLNICNLSKIEVNTEHYTDNNKRIDILLRITDSNNERTVIVIENKIDSKAHDNQICEYQDYIYGSSEYSNYERKIFIYLTKFGELPYNIGGDGKYNKEWCVFDYSKIVEMVDEILNELNKTKTYQITESEKDKLKLILEDYKDMVDTSILNNSSAARTKCKDFLSDKQVKEAFDILTAYTKIPSPAQISDYVRQRLNGKKNGNSSSWFYLDSFKEYFENKGEEYSINKLRCVCQPKTKNEDSPIVIFVDTHKKGFSPAQETLMQKFKCVKINPRLISSYTLVNEDERGKTFEDLQPILEQRIDDFKKNQLEKFDNLLKTL